MGKLRVLHIINGLGQGGAEMMMYKLLKSLDQDKYENYVFSLLDSGPMRGMIESLGVSVVDLNLGGGIKQGIKGVIKLRREVKKISPSIIQGWMYYGNIAAILARYFLLKTTPVLWNIRHAVYEIKHEKMVVRGVIRLGAWLSRKPECIIYNSYVSAGLHGDIGYLKNKSIVIPNGFDTDSFSPDSESRERVRGKLGVGQQAVLVGMVARFHPVKGYDVFLNAISILLKKYPKICVLMVGLNVDSNNSVLMKFIHDLGLEDSVNLLGLRSDIANIMASLDIFVLSSIWSEAFPNVVGEAMACGVPCVATDLGDTADIIGKTGFVVTPNNIEALAAGIDKIMKLPEYERFRYGQLARQRIQDNYSLSFVVSLYDELYQKYGEARKMNILDGSK